VDFGGTNPHAVNWYQQLRYEVETEGFHKQAIRLAEGSFVCFDEIYIAEVGNNKVAEMVVDRERYWRNKHSAWRVARRFADPQAKAARVDWAHHTPPLRTTYVATRDVKEHIKKVRELFEDRLVYFDVERSPMICEEIEAWHYPKKRPGMMDDPEIPVDDFNHCISNFRYMVANVLQLKRTGGASGRPKGAGHRHVTAKIAEQAGTTIQMVGPGHFHEGQRPKSTRGGREKFQPNG